MNKKLLLTLGSTLALFLTACADTTIKEEVEEQDIDDLTEEEMEAELEEAIEHFLEVAENTPFNNPDDTPWYEEFLDEDDDDDIELSDDSVIDIYQNIVDDDLVKIDLLDIDIAVEGISDKEVKVYFEIENKTDNEIEIRAKNVSVDGYMIDDIKVFIPHIAGNKKSIDYLLVSEKLLDEGKNFPTFEEDLEFTLRVIDYESYNDIGEYDAHIDF